MMTRRLRWHIFGPAAVFVALVSVPDSQLGAHGGGLDKYGCHHDRKAGTYHCHRGPCAGRAFPSQAGMLADACSNGR